MGTSKGWIVFTEGIGANPSDITGRDYTSWSNQGYSIIVRLNNSYGSGGTLPYEASYPNFATRCANYIKNSSGCRYWIIGNETNLPREWPGNVNGSATTGEPITATRYVSCYNKVYAAVKSVAPDAQLIPAPSGTWAQPYTTQGIPGFLDYWLAILNGIGSSKVDALALHAYTHGCNAADVFSDTKMTAPYQSIYYHFRVYKNYLTSLPTTFTTKPVFITECDQNVECADSQTPQRTWKNLNSGWVKNIYSEINTWNLNNAQKIRCVAMFRWPAALEGQYTFGIEGQTQVIADFEQACAFGYKWSRSILTRSPSTLTASVLQGNNAGSQTFIVQNTGDGTANYTIASDQAWLSVTPATGTSTTNTNTHTVNFTSSSLTPATYTATITISDPGSTGSATIGVTLNVIPLPPIVTIASPSKTVTNTGPVTFAVSYYRATSISLEAANVTLNKTNTANADIGISGSGTESRT
ncbi:MAG: hypothetical protein WCL39_15600, partial [Armatimonadota bacterium]